MRTNQQTRSSTSSKMKLALIFLSLMVAITHQQYQRQQQRIWWTPHYYPSQPSINNYQRVYQDLQDHIQPDYRQFQPTRPIIYSENEEFNAVLAPVEYQDYIDEEQYPDVQSRVKIFRQRRPMFPKKLQDQRFLFNYILSSFRTTTATFTVTSSLTLTTVESCIAAVKFKDEAAKTTACRRKRDLMDSNPEDNQFVIVPTERQRVTPTALPTLDLIQENRQVSTDQEITSSRGVFPNDISDSGSRMRSLSEPRFLNVYTVVSTTVTAFSFATATVKKAIAIADDAMVACLPSGWSIC